MSLQIARRLAMQSAAAILCLLLAGPTAQSLRIAEPLAPTAVTIEAPKGWDLMPGHSAKIATTASQTAYFGEEPIQSGAQAYRRADQGALYLTWVDSTRAHPSPEAALRHALDELHEAPFLATTDPDSTQEILYRERNFDGVAEMRFEWSHQKNETINLQRTLGWKDTNGRVHLAIAECVLQSENAQETRPLCQAALDSLHLTTAANYEAIRSLAPPKRVGSVLHAEDIQVPKLTTGDLPAGSTMGAPPSEIGEVLYNGPPPPAKKDKSNRFLVAIGILLLGAAFYLTTRSKDKVSEPAEEAKGSDDKEAEDASENNDDETQKEEKAE
jgi:hypothetical protein